MNLYSFKTGVHCQIFLKIGVKGQNLGTTTYLKKKKKESCKGAWVVVLPNLDPELYLYFNFNYREKILVKDMKMEVARVVQ